MYTILLVEDEPAAARYVESIVSKSCPDFSVVATATNGEEGLSQALSLLPDLLITDVRMPVMDGLEMMHRISVELPSVPALIVSGYEDFDYVRRALNTGVRDYLLKPVSAKKLRDALSRLAPVLAELKDAHQLELLQAALHSVGDMAEDEAQRTSGVRFRLAVERTGPPPAGPALSIDRKATRGESGVVLIPGRDDSEWIVLADTRGMRESQFLARLQERNRESASHVTTLVGDGAVTVPELSRTVKTMWAELDRTIVLEESAVIHRRGLKRGEIAIEPTLEDRLVYALGARDQRELHALVDNLVGLFRKHQAPLSTVESVVRQLWYAVRMRLPTAVGMDMRDVDLLVGEAVRRAETWLDLERQLQRLFAEMVGVEPAEPTDVPGFFRAILSYIDQHYSESVNVGELCGRFGISRSYLSRLFQTHTGGSFTEYITACRMDSAKRLLAESETMSIQQIAGLCGFEDQYYFSRVFKATVGVPPSRFRESQR